MKRLLLCVVMVVLVTSVFAAGQGEMAGDEPPAIRYMIEERPDSAINDDWPVIVAIEEAVGVDIQFEPTPQSGYDEKMNIVIATNSVPDLAYVGPEISRIHGPEGAFLPLTELIQNHGPSITALFEEYPSAQTIGTGADGEVYGVPAVQRVGWFSLAWLYRKDVVDQLGIEDPSNPREFRDMLEAFKAESPDSFPLVARSLLGRNGIYRIWSKVFTEIDGVYGFNSVEREYQSALDHPNFQVMLEFLNALYEDNLLDPEFALLGSSQWEERLLRSSAFVAYDYKGRSNTVTQKAVGADPDSSFQMWGFPPFAAEGTEPHEVASPVVRADQGVALGSGGSNPEASIRLIDFLHSEAGIRLTSYGIEGQSYTMEGGRPQISLSIGSDPVTALRTEYGALYDGIWINASQFEIPRSDAENAIEEMYAPFVLDPPDVVIETEDEIEMRTDIVADLDPFLEEELTKFVIGARPITRASVDALVSEADELGLSDLVDMFNRQLERTYGSR